jgi:hypothetical protein
VIIYHQRNVAAFAGNHTYWFLPKQVQVTRVTAAGGAGPANNEIEQARGLFRFVHTRVFGRVN